MIEATYVTIIADHVIRLCWTYLPRALKYSHGRQGPCQDVKAYHGYSNGWLRCRSPDASNWDGSGGDGIRLETGGRLRRRTEPLCQGLWTGRRAACLRW